MLCRQTTMESIVSESAFGINISTRNTPESSGHTRPCLTTKPQKPATATLKMKNAGNSRLAHIRSCANVFTGAVLAIRNRTLREYFEST